MAATPQGNVIQEMQANANVEKITNVVDREFSSDTGFWGRGNIGGTVTIVGGVCHSTNITNGYDILYTGLSNAGVKWYKITFTVLNYVSGGVAVNISDSPGPIVSTNGRFIHYVKDNSGYGYFRLRAQNSPFTGDIDNVSIQEVGWAGSQELYDGIFNQRKALGDTDEQATYAAVKAAAMWCHYNNSVDNGAIHGKLYNWFVVKLLQMDIDYYNAANPSTPWGWRVPTQADFNTLATTLGGTNVAGGKLKKEGTRIVC